MTPIWKLGTVSIIVSGEDDKPDTKLSEHVVLDGVESIIHNFGYGSGIRTLSAYILGNTGEYESLVNYYHTQDIIRLVTDQGNDIWCTIWSISRKRLLDTRRTLPSYQLSIELKKATPEIGTP
jgi:hypothetical protein